MKHWISILLLSYLLLSGCKTNPSEPSSPSADEQLKAKLIGIWKCELVSIMQFLDDGTFIDSTLLPPYTIVHGQYSVNNGLLTYSNCQIISGDTMNLPSGLTGFGQIYYASKPHFSSGNLLLNRLEIFSQSSGDASQLRGTWISNTWIALVGRWPLPPLCAGVVTSSYEFFPDSSRYHVFISYSFESNLLNIDSSGSYFYNSPYLNIANNKSINVEFIQGKMYWTYSGDPKEYKKIK